MSKLSFNPSEFVSDVRWVASLSDGREVYQDDNRYDVDISSAWLRLKDYLSNNKLKIERLRVEFRTHTEEIPPAQAGYFFSLGALKDLSVEETWHSYVLGWIDEDNKLNKITYKVPELIRMIQDKVDWSPSDIKVILNGKSTN